MFFLFPFYFILFHHSILSITASKPLNHRRLIRHHHTIILTAISTLPPSRIPYLALTIITISSPKTVPKPINPHTQQPHSLN
ncbi:hypothetical protein E1A91_D11G245700v1 [Gossypium mustelinum]|uniref:Secreted protein n=3 Tax=Gossypium TaxID=3633 RepID=A0A5J5PEX4_GOSBA|nr:hypothetical protein ES319_D11G239100v1 [Gossypium barbadense]TYG46385.1 hypothetical protein ES288_D11G252600v1 [Gossypium darwinii]TYI56915.1 hypothetical protein E1A91_D11G245700v1 [Gossypium mustelinum]